MENLCIYKLVATKSFTEYSFVAFKKVCRYCLFTVKPF